MNDASASALQTALCGARAPLLFRGRAVRMSASVARKVTLHILEVGHRTAAYRDIRWVE